MVVTGVGFATLTQLWPLLVIAIVGTLNPSSGDVSVFLPLEHAVLARSRRRSAAHRRLRALRAGRHAGRRGRIARGRRCRRCSRMTTGATMRTSLAGHVRPLRRCSASRRRWSIAGLPRALERTRGAARAADPVAARGLHAGRAVQPRRVRRRLHRAVADRAVALPALRPLARDHRARSSSRPAS